MPRSGLSGLSGLIEVIESSEASGATAERPCVSRRPLLALGPSVGGHSAQAGRSAGSAQPGLHHRPHRGQHAGVRLGLGVDAVGLEQAVSLRTIGHPGQ